ncbi:hypothetical protein BTA30_05770 [Bacillus swezeyi]|uniref:Uncharacterized protein n=1 Tax=Bacillus swezeyi TaxID=1925020 RepID=A0A1R1QDR3_9BACI|nr:hypothetical protein [Bacillus swezeyi]OMI01443.1 hypothetical protein BW143_17265 [Bacillus swezeyi]OMI31803.1 hypothetical protein BTA30_05770 [Bacillus swezeyi]
MGQLHGLNSYELLTLVYEFCRRGIIGVDFVEGYPRHDPNQSSAHFVLTLCYMHLPERLNIEQMLFKKVWMFC